MPGRLCFGRAPFPFLRCFRFVKLHFDSRGAPSGVPLLLSWWAHEGRSAFAAPRPRSLPLLRVERKCRCLTKAAPFVALLNKRAGHSLVIRGLKPGAHLGLYDPKREEEIFAKVNGYNEGPLYNENLREIYASILKVMKETPSV